MTDLKNKPTSFLDSGITLTMGDIQFLSNVLSRNENIAIMNLGLELMEAYTETYGASKEPDSNLLKRIDFLEDNRVGLLDDNPLAYLPVNNEVEEAIRNKNLVEILNGFLEILMVGDYNYKVEMRKKLISILPDTFELSGGLELQYEKRESGTIVLSFYRFLLKIDLSHYTTSHGSGFIKFAIQNRFDDTIYHTVGMHDFDLKEANRFLEMIVYKYFHEFFKDNNKGKLSIKDYPLNLTNFETMAELLESIINTSNVFVETIVDNGLVDVYSTYNHNPNLVDATKVELPGDRCSLWLNVYKNDLDSTEVLENILLNYNYYKFLVGRLKDFYSNNKALISKDKVEVINSLLNVKTTENGV